MSREYWILGTRPLQIDCWPSMHAGGYASIGWGRIGDLDHLIGGLSDQYARVRLRAAIDAAYPERKSPGHDARTVLDFYAHMAPGHRVAAMRDGQFLGLGVVKPGYFFDGKANQYEANRRKVRWVVTGVGGWAGLHLRQTLFGFSDRHPRYGELARYIERILSTADPR